MKWIEIGIALFIVIPLTQIVMSELTFSGNATHSAGIVATAANTTVGQEGAFMSVLFSFWPIIFGIALLAMVGYRLSKKARGDELED